jgi:hypothetical protein
MLNPENRLRKFRNGSLLNLKLGDWTIQSKLQALLIGVSLGSVVVVSGLVGIKHKPPSETKSLNNLQGYVQLKPSSLSRTLKI